MLNLIDYVPIVKGLGYSAVIADTPPTDEDGRPVEFAVSHRQHIIYLSPTVVFSRQLMVINEAADHARQTIPSSALARPAHPG
jgi:hypothetical protein